MMLLRDDASVERRAELAEMRQADGTAEVKIHIYSVYLCIYMYALTIFDHENRFIIS